MVKTMNLYKVCNNRSLSNTYTIPGLESSVCLKWFYCLRLRSQRTLTDSFTETIPNKRKVDPKEVMQKEKFSTW